MVEGLTKALLPHACEQLEVDREDALDIGEYGINGIGR